MKKLQLSNLSIRTKFTLITIVTTMLVAVSMFVAGNLIHNESENQAAKTTIRGKVVLWTQISSNQLDQLSLGMRHLTRDRSSIQALSEGDAEALSESISTTYTRLNAADMLDDLYITNKAGRLQYASNDAPLETTRMSLVHEAINNSKVLRSLEKNDAGKIALITAFPVYSGSKIVGAGIYEKHIKWGVEEFAKNDESEVFIVDDAGSIQHGTNMDFYKALALELPAIDTRETRVIHHAEKVYTVSFFPLMNNTGAPVAQLISINDTTEAVLAEQRIEFIAYAIILALTTLALLGLFLYVRRTLTPLKKLMSTVSLLAEGDISARANITTNDEIGQLSAAFNNMAQQIQDSIETERQTGEDIKGKVELILEVVESAADGDLSGEMMVFSEDDAIGQLSKGIQRMLDNLNSLVAQVQKSGVQVASSANQIAATAKEQEATITEQVATTNEIVATSKQISSTSKELLVTMEEVADVSHSTSDSAESGRQALSQMEQTMQLMVDASSAITSKLAVLNEKAQNINAVVTTITKVADQTNLLSLNAAIEAEKAGEYGVGFSVVATEIRRLADQTAVATWDIEQIVQEMQSAVSAGVMGMDKFSEDVRSGVSEVNKVGVQLSDIIGHVQDLLPKFENVHEGMQSQAYGASQITESIIQLNDAAEQTAESLRQSNESISRLNDAAHGLQSEISVFKTNEQ